MSAAAPEKLTCTSVLKKYQAGLISREALFAPPKLTGVGRKPTPESEAVDAIVAATGITKAAAYKRLLLIKIRCRQCNGWRGNWPAELAITDKGEPMTTKTKTTTKTKPAPAPIEDMPEPISAEARLPVLLEERRRAMEILAAFFGVPSDPGLEAMAETAVGYARELERTIKDGGKAGPSCAAVGRILTETILSGRGEIQITIRPYAAPASTPTEAQP